MDKKSKDIIKEVINHILEYRSDELWENDNRHSLPYDWEEKDRLNKITMERFDKPLVKLNHLLSKKEQYEEILEIEKEMIKIKSKKYLSVKELSELYPGMSPKAQQSFRGRINDPLPYEQLTENGKITYDVDKVKEWRERQDRLKYN